MIVLELEAMVECCKSIDLRLNEWIKKVILIEPDETSITLLRNWLLSDFISQCDRSTDSNNLKVAMKNSPHAGKLPVTFI